MNSFLVIAPQGLGDALEATPLVAALKRAMPRARIDAAVLRPGPRQLFEGLPELVDRVRYYPYWERGVWYFLHALSREAGSIRYDASLLAYPAARPEYHLLAWLHRARKRVAHAYWKTSPWNLQWLETDLAPVRHEHNVLRNLDLLRAIDVGVDDETPPAYVAPRAWIAGDRSASRIAIHIGTVVHHGLEAKRWPAERFTELTRRLRQRGYDLYVIAGPDERAASARIAAAVPGVDLVEGSISDVARFLSGCALAVTNDSGIGHLAAAVGTPVLAVHGPTPVEGGPYGPSAVRFRPSACPPCFDPRRRNTSCALGIDYACLKRDTPVDVVEERVLQILGVERQPA